MLSDGPSATGSAGGPGPNVVAANPIANADERAAEVTALRVFALVQVQEARARAAQLFRLAYGEQVPREALPAFESAIGEYVFNYVLKAVASDAHHPRFVRNFMPAHRWFGCAMPGARMGGDNPDNCYRLAGIAPDAHYVVRGNATSTMARSVSFTLVANYGTSVTIQTLDGDGLRPAADGSFEITIGPEAAADNPNHLRTRSDVKFLYVRDSMEDWERETPLALEIRRVEPPAADPLRDVEMAARAVHRLIEEVPLYYWFSRLCSARSVNTVANPMGAGALGGLVSQAGAQGVFRVADDEAMVLTLDPAGARYASIGAYDWWFRSLDYWNRTSSLTQSASLPNDDGTFTYVISPTDPGVHNWIDTCGLHEILMIYRWQGLPAAQVRNGPALHSARLVKLSKLKGLLPAGQAWVSRQQRTSQCAARAAAFARRIQEY